VASEKTDLCANDFRSKVIRSSAHRVRATASSLGKAEINQLQAHTVYIHGEPQNSGIYIDRLLSDIWTILPLESRATLHRTNDTLPRSSSPSSYSFIRGCQTQPTTYGTKNRCTHIHGHTHNTYRLKYIYTHSRTVSSSSYYGWCRLEMREKRRQCSSLMHIAESYTAFGSNSHQHLRIIANVNPVAWSIYQSVCKHDCAVQKRINR